MSSILKKTVLGLGLAALCISANASPCDGAAIDIVNQTSKSMQLITSEGFLETKITPMKVGDAIAAHSERTIIIDSGIGTSGDARGLLAFRNSDETQKHRFISVSFDFKNKFWLTCDKKADVLNTSSNDFEVHVLPGYKSNLKVYVVE